MVIKRMFFPICGAAKPTPSLAIMVLDICRYNSRQAFESISLPRILTDFFRNRGLGLVTISNIFDIHIYCWFIILAYIYLYGNYATISYVKDLEQGSSK